jgi:hypothetical protein
MSIFVQATKYDVHMYENFECLNVYRFLQLNTARFNLLPFPIMQ